MRSAVFVIENVHKAPAELNKWLAELEGDKYEREVKSVTSCVVNGAPEPVGNGIPMMKQEQYVVLFVFYDVLPAVKYDPLVVESL